MRLRPPRDARALPGVWNDHLKVAPAKHIGDNPNTPRQSRWALCWRGDERALCQVEALSFVRQRGAQRLCRGGVVAQRPTPQLTMIQPLLQSRNLTLSYGTRPALRGVNLNLSSGQVVALLGPNGSGKSTLIQSLFGHLQAEGEIQWFDKPLKKWSPRELAKRVAYLPQSPQYHAGQPVLEALQLGRSPYWAGFGLESPRDSVIVKNVAEQLGLNEILHRPMDELSGGQRQRVFIGRCLVQEPAALLLDEPNTYLDLKHQVELCQLLKQLSQTQSIGVLMASHDLNLAAAFADRVVVMSQGKVVADGGAEVLEAGMLSEVYGVKLISVARSSGAAIVVPDIANFPKKSVTER